MICVNSRGVKIQKYLRKHNGLIKRDIVSNVVVSVLTQKIIYFQGCVKTRWLALIWQFGAFISSKYLCSSLILWKILYYRKNRSLLNINWTGLYKWGKCHELFSFLFVFFFSFSFCGSFIHDRNSLMIS